jgi:integrase
MPLLMARLGLRAPAVVVIRLDDIDWREGEILIRGKGKLYDGVSLPRDVGEAVVDYMKLERKGASRALLVSAKTPCPPYGRTDRQLSAPRCIRANAANTALEVGKRTSGFATASRWNRRVCGPLANSLFTTAPPEPLRPCPESKLPIARPTAPSTKSSNCWRLDAMQT